MPALRSGETLLVRPLYRDERPVLFWTVTVLWVAFGVMMVLVDAAPSALEGVFGSMWGS